VETPYGHNNGNEDNTCYPREGESEYARTKILAEKLVLTADSKTLSTCAIRPTHLYGPYDFLALPVSVKAIKSGELKYILGDGKALFDIVYVDNVSYAHILASQHLYPESKVNGQAYFLGENTHINYFEFLEPFVLLKGCTMPKIHLPLWLLLFIAFIFEWVSILINTIINIKLIQRNILKNSTYIHEPLFTRGIVNALCRNQCFTYNKATKDFNYQPIVKKEEALKRTLEWFNTYDC